ncbi:MAG: hypothetical protein M1837_006414 [Sclerophora amabilis]|nr:MAG: hypothetical protein M1837_006414 [Sclerophora amabilis]
MASARFSFDSKSQAPPSLAEKLAEALPQDVRFNYYHLCSPPTKCDPIFPAPPNTEPDRTRCESHLLAIATPSKSPTSTENGEELREEQLVYAMEVLIYTTKRLTTLFVSKADSTGFLSRAELPPKCASPLKTISSTFISHLFDTHQRIGVRFVVSLFARAQDQYIFPGSVENDEKHVMDDRGLIKWWCRVLDPVLRRNRADNLSGNNTPSATPTTAGQAEAYLLVPGLDRHETQALLPPSVKADFAFHKRWHHGHPLLDICSNSGSVPPRCLIPHFPDDPKARFLDELDQELSEGSKANRGATAADQATNRSSPKKAKSVGTGQWRSVRTLEQFWEAMEFRQECSSGRAVGFIWVVFPPPVQNALGRETQTRLHAERGRAVQQSETTTTLPYPVPVMESTDTEPTSILPTPLPSQEQKPPNPLSPVEAPTDPAIPQSLSSNPVIASENRSRRLGRRPLTGPVLPLDVHRRLHQRQGSSHSSSAHLRSRGQIIVPHSIYTRAVDLLLRLSFATPAVGAASAKHWITEVGAVISTNPQKLEWGSLIVGQHSPASGYSSLRNEQRDDHRPDKPSGSTTSKPTENVETNNSGGVNVLSTSLVRKKDKKENKRKVDRSSNDVDESNQPLTTTATATAPAPQETQARQDLASSSSSLSVSTPPAEGTVNLLGPGFVRKKVKK